MDNICLNCINCIVYKKQYSCDFEMWNDKKLNDILLFIPQMFDCEQFEEYKGNKKHLEVNE